MPSAFAHFVSRFGAIVRSGATMRRSPCRIARATAAMSTRCPTCDGTTRTVFGAVTANVASTAGDSNSASAGPSAACSPAPSTVTSRRCPTMRVPNVDASCTGLHRQRRSADDEGDLAREQPVRAPGRGRDGRLRETRADRADRERQDRALRSGEHRLQTFTRLVAQDPGPDVRLDRHDCRAVEAEAAFDLAAQRLRRPTVEDAFEPALVVLHTQVDAIGPHAPQHGSEDLAQWIAGATGGDRGPRRRPRVDVHVEQRRIGREELAVDAGAQRRLLQLDREARDLVVHRHLVAHRRGHAVDLDSGQYATCVVVVLDERQYDDRGDEQTGGDGRDDSDPAGPGRAAHDAIHAGANRGPRTEWKRRRSLFARVARCGLRRGGNHRRRG